MEKTRRRWVRWTKKKRDAFLDHLAGTCNVRAAWARQSRDRCGDERAEDADAQPL